MFVWTLQRMLDLQFLLNLSGMLCLPNLQNMHLRRMQWMRALRPISRFAGLQPGNPVTLYR
jgi:hypothetical protein